MTRIYNDSLKQKYTIEKTIRDVEDIIEDSMLETDSSGKKTNSTAFLLEILHDGLRGIDWEKCEACGDWFKYEEEHQVLCPSCDKEACDIEQGDRAEYMAHLDRNLPKRGTGYRGR